MVLFKTAVKAKSLTMLIFKAVLFLIILLVTTGSCENYLISSYPEQGSTLSDDADFICPTSYGLYPHEEKCESYYSCVNYKATLYQCTQDNLYDVRIKLCNIPENTDCGNRIRPPTYPTTATPPPQFECPIEVADDWFADPNNCASFYRCVSGQTYHYTCAPPTLFDDVRKECDHPRNVDCGNRPFPSNPYQRRFN